MEQIRPIILPNISIMNENTVDEIQKILSEIANNVNDVNINIGKSDNILNDIDKRLNEYDAYKKTINKRVNESVKKRDELSKLLDSTIQLTSYEVRRLESLSDRMKEQDDNLRTTLDKLEKLRENILRSDLLFNQTNEKYQKITIIVEKYDKKITDAEQTLKDQNDELSTLRDKASSITDLITELETSIKEIAERTDWSQFNDANDSILTYAKSLRKSENLRVKYTSDYHIMYQDQRVTLTESDVINIFYEKANREKQFFVQVYENVKMIKGVKINVEKNGIFIKSFFNKNYTSDVDYYTVITFRTLPIYLHDKQYFQEDKDSLSIIFIHTKVGANDIQLIYFYDDKENAKNKILKYTHYSSPLKMFPITCNFALPENEKTEISQQIKRTVLKNIANKDDKIYDLTIFYDKAFLDRFEVEQMTGDAFTLVFNTHTHALL